MMSEIRCGNYVRAVGASEKTQLIFKFYYATIRTEKDVRKWQTKTQ